MGLTVYFLATPPSRVEIIANNFLGEQWYVIHMGEAQIGYMRNTVKRTDEGDWGFATTTHFDILNNSPVTTSKTLVFSQKSPHNLIRAKYRTIKQSIDNEIEIELVDQKYSTSIRRGYEITNSQYEWDFNLTDYLSVELWLYSESPERYDRKVGKSLDIENLRVVKRAYSVTENNNRGYVIESGAAISPTKIQLDRNHQPTNLSMAGIFEITLSDRKKATALSNITSKTSLSIPLNQRIINPQGIKDLRLQLKLTGKSVENVVDNLPDTISSLENSDINAADKDSYLGSTIRYPVSHPIVLKLDGRPEAVNSVRDLERLVRYTHSLLRYKDDKAVGSVLKSLELGYGECTDFTDLFTTLARTYDIPTRPVYGIAYKDSSQPGFMFHSWNEIFFQDRWVAIDATWNQTPADPTHISLNDVQYSSLLLLSTTKSVQLAVDQITYR